MENYREYLERMIAEAIELDMPISRDAYQDSLDTYLSYQDADELRSTRVVVIGKGPRPDKVSRFAELYGSIGPAVQLAIGSKHSHDNVDRVIANSMRYERERGITINQTLLEDRSFKLVAVPRMTEPVIPLDKYGKPLEFPKSKFHK
jgi:hypothetical protein